MTRNELARARIWYAHMERAGFDADTADRLRRIERTLHHWAEHECNGEIERAGDDADGAPYWSSPDLGRHMIARIPDRERGALRRLAAIMADHPDWTAYHQGDPRGCALYLVHKADIPAGVSVDCCYNRGIAVCY